MIVISSSTTHSWLADSKEVIKIESLIANTLPLESMIATKILVTGLVNKNNKLNARL
jgi:5'(3')-deoxyribonucleotidase